MVQRAKVLGVQEQKLYTKERESVVDSMLVEEILNHCVSPVWLQVIQQHTGP